MPATPRPTARRLAVALVLLAAAPVVASCDRTVTPTEALPPLQAASLDADAGMWRMLLLPAPDAIVVPAPAPVTSEAYRAELAALKAAQGG